MTNEELITRLQGVKTICINGKTAAGKTTLTNLLKKSFPNHSYYHNDDYKPYGFEGSLYAMMEDIESDPNDYKIIEGIQVPRLLRKGAQTGKFTADLIIELSCSEENRVKRYILRGDKDKIPNLKAFDQNLAKIWFDFVGYGNVPPIIRINTD